LPRPTRFPWILSGIGLTFFAYLLFLQSRGDLTTNGSLRVISDLFVLAGAVIGALACFKTSWWLYRVARAEQLRFARRASIGWVCVAGAALAYALGQGIWTGYDAQAGSPPFPAAYDPFYLAVYPLSWVGIALLLPRGSLAGNARLVLDATTAVCSALAISWFFILEPTLTGLSGSALEKGVALAYPLGDLSLCIIAAILLFGPGNLARWSGAIGRLAIGVTSLAVTDSLYAVLQLEGVYHTGFLQDLGWPLAWLFIGWAARVSPGEVIQAERSPFEAALDWPLTRNKLGAALRASAPFFLALVTSALLLLEAALRHTGSLTQVVIISALLVLFPAIRQVLTLIENFHLTEQLQQALKDTKRAFERGQLTLQKTLEQVQEDNQEFEQCIREVRRVQAEIAVDPFSTRRAYLEGQLSPVAASLNLLLRRIQHWSKQEQMVAVLENEAKQLVDLLEQLSEGAQAEVYLTPRSSLMTGSALLAGERLQRSLAQRFQGLRNAISGLGPGWKRVQEALRRLELALADDFGADRTRLTNAAAELEEALTLFQRRFSQIYRLAQVYDSPAGGSGTCEGPRSATSPLTSEEKP
jgi:hypothetical protein